MPWRWPQLVHQFIGVCVMLVDRVEEFIPQSIVLQTVEGTYLEIARCQEIILTLFRTSLHPYSSLRLKLLNYCENPKQITVIIWLELFKETWSKISHWLIMNFEKSQGVETVGLQSALTNRFIISVDICVLVLVCLWRHTLPMWVANLTTVP